ncbi:MAG: 3TM-type holin, partial [Alphaproteobacteria bacterium]|nr:3TM-type holin [Alphaproteobacteria bacterium]
MLPVAMAAQLALGLVQGPLAKILDAYVSDLELKRKLAAEIEQQTLGYFTRSAELGAEVVLAETNSEHWLSRSWRPLLMLVLMGFLLLVGLVLPLADLIAG